MSSRDINSELLDSSIATTNETQHNTTKGRCLVSPHPDLKKKMVQELERMKKGGQPALSRLLGMRGRKVLGRDDGLRYPPEAFSAGTPSSEIRRIAGAPPVLRGTLSVAVVLVRFPDEDFDAAHDVAHFDELFFSSGTHPTGSVRDYFTEVSNGAVDVTGTVVGPYLMPRTLEAYANGDHGIGLARPNAQTMAHDAAQAANPDVDFAGFDNDGDGYVDAFVVVHAGRGAEVTGDVGDIWSHKWNLPSVYNADGARIWSYLTVPEDAHMGVCAHELGHLLFGWPDLYDTDGSSEGVGVWCLMGSGSWLGNGHTPAHPSAWCKATQGWITVVNSSSNRTAVAIPDVKDASQAHRLWTDGRSGPEYFLVENRQKKKFDAELPGEGLLIWHIDETIPDNHDESRYKVALEQADGLSHLQNRNNRGDAIDPFPGSAQNTTFDETSTPSSRSNAGSGTCVAVRNISGPGDTMRADLMVRCRITKAALKDVLEPKTRIFDNKMFEKPQSWEKPPLFEFPDKPSLREKPPEKPETDKSIAYDKFEGEKPFDKPRDFSGDPRPFIGAGLRPDLRRSALAAEADVSRGDDVLELVGDAKRAFDTKLSEI